VLDESPPPTLLATVLHQFRSPLISILLVAAAVTLLLGEHLDAMRHRGGAPPQRHVIGTASRNVKAEQSVRALQQLVSPRARVLREGHEHEVDSAELVPGDVVLLESGARVPGRRAAGERARG
jgi:magnesium-transporting ATPase (P-type)